MVRILKGDVLTKKWQKENTEVGRVLRNHKIAGPKGANVTFYQGGENQRSIQAVTFERGVEGFTLACGTGAVAAAVAHACGTEQKEIEVRMPGGLLTVFLDREEDHNWNRLIQRNSRKTSKSSSKSKIVDGKSGSFGEIIAYLQGPAILIAKAEIY